MKANNLIVLTVYSMVKPYKTKETWQIFYILNEQEPKATSEGMSSLARFQRVEILYISYSVKKLSMNFVSEEK